MRTPRDPTVCVVRYRAIIQGHVSPRPTKAWVRVQASARNSGCVRFAMENRINGSGSQKMTDRAWARTTTPICNVLSEDSMAQLDPKVTPALLDSESGTAIKTDVTLYLNINLDNGLTDDKSNSFGMTAVYLPDPAMVTDPVTVLLWFHGHKDGSTVSLVNKSPNPKAPLNLKGYTIKQYLDVDEYHLREFIAKTSKRKFILVAPMLNDYSKAGLLGTEAEAEGYLAQVINGVNAHAKAKTKLTGPGNMILGAHSGGGSIMSKVCNYGGSFAKTKEIWCVDCTYGSGPTFKEWAKKKTSKGGRLWVFSTGSWEDTVPTELEKQGGPDS